MSKKDFFTQLLQYNNYIGMKDDVSKERGVLDSINSFIDNIEVIDSSSITSGKLDISNTIDKAFPESDIIKKYKAELESLKPQIKNSNKLSKLYSDMTNTRDSFIEYLVFFIAYLVVSLILLRIMQDLI